jgi:predicted thioesterase
MDKIISETLEKEKYLSERDVMRLAILSDEQLVLTGKIERLVVIRDEINQEIKEIRGGVLDE